MVNYVNDKVNGQSWDASDAEAIETAIASKPCTVADKAAAKLVEPTAGASIIILSDDGAGMVFEAVTGLTGQADDSVSYCGTQIAYSTTAVWRRKYNGDICGHWFGFFGDEVESIAELQEALDAANALTNKANVLLRGGNYKIDVTSSSVNIHEGVGIIGPGTYQPIGTTMYGATFFIVGTANPAFLAQRGNQIQGVNFYYPDQVTTASPIAYDWTIQLDVTSQSTQGVDIIDCVFINPYKGINLNGTTTGFIPGSTFLSRIRMCPINTGIEIGHTAVNIWMNQIVLTSEFWSSSVGQPVRDYMAQNSAGIHVISSDSLHVSQYTAFFLQYAVRFSGGTSYAVNFCHFQGAIFDGCRYGLRMEIGTTVQTLKLTACDFLSKEQGDDSVFSEGLSIASTALVDKIMAAACYFGPTNGSHIVLTHPSGTSIGYYNFSACQFEIAGRDYSGAAAPHNLTINSTSAQVSLENCHFKNITANSITCIKTFAVSFLNIIGCTFDQHEKVIDFAGTNLTMIGNSSKTTNATYVYTTMLPTGKLIEENNNWDKPALISDHGTFTTSDATPSVSQGSTFITADTTTYTDFDGAYEGKVITLLAKHAATVTDNANINTSTGANKVLTVDVTYSFISIGGVWYEQATA